MMFSEMQPASHDVVAVGGLDQHAHLGAGALASRRPPTPCSRTAGRPRARGNRSRGRPAERSSSACTGPTPDGERRTQSCPILHLDDGLDERAPLVHPLARHLVAANVEVPAMHPHAGHGLLLQGLDEHAGGLDRSRGIGGPGPCDVGGRAVYRLEEPTQRDRPGARVRVEVGAGGACPSPPASPAARSDRRSPNRLSVRITSNRAGSVTR